MKKAIQLSKLSGCEIDLKIFHEDDGSLLHYLSEDCHDLQARIPGSEDVRQYMKFYNKNEDIVNQLENKITSHGARNQDCTDENSFVAQIEKELDGYNIIQFFLLGQNNYKK